MFSLLFSPLADKITHNCFDLGRQMCAFPIYASNQQYQLAAASPLKPTKGEQFYGTHIYESFSGKKEHPH